MNGETVAIGLPVRDGGSFLEAALRDLLDQDWPAFTVWISDNASTDQTQTIVETVQDTRIKYERLNVDIGPTANFNRVLQGSADSFFMWAAHDDRRPAQYMRRAVEVLQEFTDAAGTVPTVEFLDLYGSALGTASPSELMMADAVATRVDGLLTERGWFAIYGVFRREIIGDRRIPDCAGPDVVFLFELLRSAKIRPSADSVLKYCVKAPYRSQVVAAPRQIKSWSSSQMFVELFRRTWTSGHETMWERIAITRVIAAAALTTRAHWRGSLAREYRLAARTQIRNGALLPAVIQGCLALFFSLPAVGHAKAWRRRRIVDRHSPTGQ